MVCVSLLLLTPAWSQNSQVDSEALTDPLIQDTQQEDQASANRGSAQRQYYRDSIETVLLGEEFGVRETIKRWRFKDLNDKSQRDKLFPQWLIELLEWFEGSESTMLTVATTIEILLWVLAGLAVAWLVYRYRHLLEYFREPQAAKHIDLPVSMFGVELAKEIAEHDPVAKAKSLWQAGEPRQAVVILLVNSLHNLVAQFECEFRASHTESECLRIVRRATPKRVHGYMAKLIEVWINIAYAHKSPDTQVFALLCDEWEVCFESQ